MQYFFPFSTTHTHINSLKKDYLSYSPLLSFSLYPSLTHSRIHTHTHAHTHTHTHTHTQIIAPALKAVGFYHVVVSVGTLCCF